MKKIITATIAALALVGGATATADATPHKVRSHTLSQADHDVKRVKIRHFEELTRGRALVAFNDGSVFILRPCPLEDSPRCWWDAGESGNGIGHSFVQVKGHTFYLDRIKGVAR